MTTRTKQALLNKEIIKKVRSGIVSISFYRNNLKIASGSGFFCKNKLVSNNHAFMTPNNQPISGSTIKIFSGDNPSDPILEQPYDTFMQSLVCGSDRNSYDYAVFKPEVDYKKYYQFELGDHNEIEEGEEVIILGYPFEIENLTTHIGYISAKYQKNNVNVMQLDASVNSGNSGGPLINPKTLDVVGIVTRKYSGLYLQFDELINSFAVNAEVLQRSSGGVFLGGVDTNAMLAISQRQLAGIAENIKRSANTGIGYAFSCDKLMQENFYHEKTK